MSTWQRFKGWVGDEWNMAGALGRAAMVAAPLFMATTLFLAGALALFLFRPLSVTVDFPTPVIPTVDVSFPTRELPPWPTFTPRPTATATTLRGGVTRHAPTPTPDN